MKITDTVNSYYNSENSKRISFKRVLVAKPLEYYVQLTPGFKESIFFPDNETTQKIFQSLKKSGQKNIALVKEGKISKLNGVNSPLYILDDIATPDATKYKKLMEKYKKKLAYIAKASEDILKRWLKQSEEKKLPSQNIEQKGEANFFGEVEGVPNVGENSMLEHTPTLREASLAKLQKEYSGKERELFKSYKEKAVEYEILAAAE